MKLFNSNFNIEDFTDLLATNVNLIIADDDTPYVKNSIIIPSEVYIDFKHNNKIKIKLANILDYDFASVNSTNRILRFSVNNLNMNKAAKIFDRIKPLNNDDINALKADEYIVLASGPSLKDNIEKIKELQSKGIKTVAVDTALACLNNYNIIPDIIVSHDPIVYVQFKNLILKNKDNFKNTFLICSAHSEQAFIEDYPGPIKYIFDDNDVKIVPEIDCELKNFIKFAGSVLLETTAILKRVSPKKIHLFGCDFAYKGNTTHAGNLYNEVSEKDTKKNYGSFIKILCPRGTACAPLPEPLESEPRSRDPAGLGLGARPSGRRRLRGAPAPRAAPDWERSQRQRGRPARPRARTQRGGV